MSCHKSKHYVMLASSGCMHLVPIVNRNWQGRVCHVDKDDGDAFIKFDGIDNKQWLFEDQFGNL